MEKKLEKILKQILDNQKGIMIWIHGMKTKNPFYEGYFKLNIEATNKLMEGLN